MYSYEPDRVGQCANNWAEGAILFLFLVERSRFCTYRNNARCELWEDVYLNFFCIFAVGNTKKRNDEKVSFVFDGALCNRWNTG